MSNDLVNTGPGPNKTTSDSIYDLPPEMAGEQREAYVALVRASSWDGHTFALERLPTADERKLLVQRYRALDPVVTPISYASSAKQRAGAEIADMFKSWPAFKPGSLEESIGHYVMVMQDLPLFAIKEACLDIAHGKIEQLSTYAPPPAPFVYKLAQDKAKRIIDQHVTIRRILSTKNIPIEYKPSAAEKERIFEGLQARATEISEAERKIIEERQQEVDTKKLEYTRATILREYQERGIPPVLFNGQPISMSLLKNIKEFQDRPAGRRDDNQDLGS